MSTKNTSRFMPLIIAISVVAGILIGTFYARHFAGNKLGIINSSSNKLQAPAWSSPITLQTLTAPLACPSCQNDSCDHRSRSS